MAKDKNYTELSAELEAIIIKLQSTDLDVDEAIKAYERGITLAKEIETYLKRAENKIKRIQDKS